MIKEMSRELEKIIEKKYMYYAFAPKVLAVAVINSRSGKFSVFIDAVEGSNYIEESKAVASYGKRMSEHIAKTIFPILFEKYVWRD